MPSTRPVGEEKMQSQVKDLICWLLCPLARCSGLTPGFWTLMTQQVSRMLWNLRMLKASSGGLPRTAMSNGLWSWMYGRHPDSRVPWAKGLARYPLLTTYYHLLMTLTNQYRPLVNHCVRAHPSVSTIDFSRLWLTVIENQSCLSMLTIIKNNQTLNWQ